MTPERDEDDPYVEEVRRKAKRMSRARHQPRSVWSAFAQAGTVGWLFVLPLIVGTLLGHTVSQLVEHDGPTLAGMLVGLAIGLFQAARSIRASLEEDDDTEEAP